MADLRLQTRPGNLTGKTGPRPVQSSLLREPNSPLQPTWGAAFTCLGLLLVFSRSISGKTVVEPKQRQGTGRQELWGCPLCSSTPQNPKLLIKATLSLERCDPCLQFAHKMRKSVEALGKNPCSRITRQPPLQERITLTRLPARP